MDGIKTILVPTDFSGPANNALKYAVSLAVKTNAKILVLHVYHILVVPGRYPHALYPIEIQDNRKLAEQELMDLEKKVPELKKVVYNTKLISGYGGVDEILETIQAQNTDLTVMGTRGASGLKELLIGSNTASVIKGATRPVLAIPEQAQYREIRNIGFAYDHEPIEDMSQMDTLMEFAKLFKAVIQIFHVREDTEDIEVEPVVVGDPLNKYLKKTTYSYTNVYENDVREGIDKYIDEKDIDILAMIPRRHDIFHRLFKSSITKKMAFRSTIPLLALPE